MRRVRVRFDPLVLLLALLPLIGWGAGLEDAAHRRRSDLQAARSAYVMGLTVTRTQLSALLSRVTSDATLVQNLNWKLPHSVQSALEAKLQRGSLDQVSLVDKSCGDLGKAAFEKLLALPCPFGKNGAAAAEASDGFFWLKSDDGPPVLALARKVAGLEGSEATAIGAVQLDDTWLSLHPELKTRMTALDLRIGGAGGVDLLKEGVDASGTAVASLASDNLVDRLLLVGPGRELSTGNPLLWPCLALAFACAALTLWRERAERLRSKEAFGQFLAWARSLSPGEAVAATGKPAVDLEAAKKLAQHALQLKSDAASGLTAKRQALETQLKTKEEELQKHRQRLAELAELDSLAVQLQRTSAAFLARMDEFHGKAEDLADVVGGTLAGQGHALFNLLRDWQQGVAERGARKFLRSLSETTGQREGVSELDEQLEVLASLAGGISDLAVNASAMAHKLVETAAFASRLAGLWHGLSLKAHDDECCPSLLAPMEEAQGLIVLEAAFSGLTFSNLVPAEADLRLPELPKPVWVSALYHLYLAMAELTQGVEASIATRLRQDGEKLLCVIQVAGAGGVPLPKRGEKQAYHMEITRSILAPFAISLSVLPTLDGPYPVALAWSSAEPYKRPAPGMAANGRAASL